MTKNQNFNFNDIIEPAHQNSRDKGFWDDCRKWLPAPEGAKLYGHIDAAILLDELDRNKVKAVLLQKILLIMTEVGEAYDEVRKGGDLSALRYAERYHSQSASDRGAHSCGGPPDCWCRQPHKPIGYASELADILIRIADLYGATGFLPSARDSSDFMDAQSGEYAVLHRDRWFALACSHVAHAMDFRDAPGAACHALASVVYDVLVLAHFDNIDIGAAVEAKMAYNKTRPRKHGKLF